MVGPASETDHDRWGLVVQLRNDSAPARKRGALAQRWRQLLEPWRLKHDLIDEVRRLVELGEATVLRAPVGTDAGHVPLEPAIIEFEDEGKLCFFRPPFGHQTIQVEPSLRKEIMEVAERLNAINAQEQRVRERRVASKRRRSASRAQDTPVDRRPPYNVA